MPRVLASPWKTCFAKIGSSAPCNGMMNSGAMRLIPTKMRARGSKNANPYPSFRPAMNDFCPAGRSARATRMNNTATITPENATACTRKFFDGPTAAIIAPPRAGPIDRDRLNASQLSATAFGITCLGTSSNTNVWRAGI